MNLLLDLVRLRVNKADNPRLYTAAIRDHLLTNAGVPSHTSAIADPDDANGRRIDSLRR